MASNQTTIADEDGDYSDWLELYNPTNDLIHLSGWYLSDDQADLTKWAFPAVTIDPDEYLLVFASDKDRKGGELHTSFKLSKEGEDISLVKPDGETIVFSMLSYPGQSEDISYGWVDGNWVFLKNPSPGRANTPDEILLPAPQFSVSRGFFESTFTLEIQSPIAGGEIIYTLDGSAPTLINGEIYQQPLLIDRTSVVRATVMTATEGPGKIATHTYLFPASVVYQPDTIPGYPDDWGDFSTIPGKAPADYGMDPEITQSEAYRDSIIAALNALSSISLVTHKDHFFSHRVDPDSGGIYIHTGPPTGGFGEGWERPVSFEYLHPNGQEGIQADCGIRIQGGHSRVPEKNPKHSFRVVFRTKYGPKKLEYDFFGGEATTTFNTLVMRAGFNQTWLHWSGSQRRISQYINDSWVKDTYRKMGHLSAHNRFVHLYINGLYWGVYNLSERMDKEFMATYLDGKESEFDVIKDFAEVADGNKEAWDEMMEMALDTTAFMRIQGKTEQGEADTSLINYLNAENLMDYMILNFYIGNRDWDHHNWVAVRNRENPSEGFAFLPWDSERSFIGLRDNVVHERNENRPSFLFQQFRNDIRFRSLFAERVKTLLGTEGYLSPDSVMAGWKIRSDEIALAIIAESARWGDYRRDLHPYSDDNFDLYTKHDHWDVEQERLMKNYFPFRSDTVYRQLLEIGLGVDPFSGLGEAGSFPNPFSSMITIFYRLQSEGQVEVEIFDLSGRRVEQLFSGEQSTGLHQIYWVPRDLNNGMYFYRIRQGNSVRTGKIMLVR